MVTQSVRFDRAIFDDKESVRKWVDSHSSLTKPTKESLEKYVSKLFIEQSPYKYDRDTMGRMVLVNIYKEKIENLKKEKKLATPKEARKINKKIKKNEKKTKKQKEKKKNRK